MRIAWFNQGKYEFGSAILIYSHAGLRSRGRQIAEEIWTCDLIQIWASLCVAGRDSIEYLWGVLYYVLLHVLNHYNIQIVWGFQLYAFPELHTVLMCFGIWVGICFWYIFLVILLYVHMYMDVNTAMSYAIKFHYVVWVLCHYYYVVMLLCYDAVKLSWCYDVMWVGTQ